LGKGVRAISDYSEFEALVALDRYGQVTWFWESVSSLMDVKLTSRNTLLVLTTDGCIQEIDFKGETLRKWYTSGREPKDIEKAILVDTRYFHHAVCELPNGHFSSLSVSTRTFDDYKMNQENPEGEEGCRTLVGDTLVEFSADGSIIKEIDFFDLLDPYRFGYGLDGPFWSRVGVVPGGADWSHANGICYDQSDDSFIITVRHQDCVIKVDRGTGSLKWILGTPDGWSGQWRDKLLTPIGDIDWHWHPHDPTITADGNLLIFDNGESGAVPPNLRPHINVCNSRVLAYRVNEAEGTVKQIWSFGGKEHALPYSMYVSGAIELPTTRNVFITCGGITLTKKTKERTNLPPQGHGSVELFEVTPSKSPEIIFHAEINNRETEEANGWAAFRAEWIPESLLSI